jgi:hypothetical protein
VEIDAGRSGRVFSSAKGETCDMCLQLQTPLCLYGGARSDDRAGRKNETKKGGPPCRYSGSQADWTRDGSVETFLSLFNTVDFMYVSRDEQRRDVFAQERIPRPNWRKCLFVRSTGHCPHLSCTCSNASHILPPLQYAQGRSDFPSSGHLTMSVGSPGVSPTPTPRPEATHTSCEE